MNTTTAVVEYKRFKNAGYFGVVSAAVIALLFALIWDTFQTPTQQFAAIGVIVMELCAGIAGFILGTFRYTIDESGITRQLLSGAKTRAWSELQTYGIEVETAGRVQSAKIRVCFENPKKVIVLPCREDILNCMRLYCGAPAYDKRTERTNEP